MINFLILIFYLLKSYAHPCFFNNTQISNNLNNYRTMHQAPNVIYDSNIASVSQTWANFMAKDNVFRHSNTYYGENLALFGSGKILDCTDRANKAIDAWYTEGLNYNYTNNGFNNLYGHFTQSVWVSSKYIGVGIAYGNNKIYVVMNFNPPGNYAGKFTINVLPPNNLKIMPLSPKSMPLSPKPLSPKPLSPMIIPLSPKSIPLSPMIIPLSPKTIQSSPMIMPLSPSYHKYLPIPPETNKLSAISLNIRKNYIIIMQIISLVIYF